MTEMLSADYVRTLFIDSECESFLRTMIGGVALDHYLAMALPAHRADFFRYVLLFFRGGCYFDMKSALLVSLSHILEAASQSTLISCIGRAGHHIHQGILMCPPHHPMLFHAIRQVLNTQVLMCEDCRMHGPSLANVCAPSLSMFTSRAASTRNIRGGVATSPPHNTNIARREADPRPASRANRAGSSHRLL